MKQEQEETCKPEPKQMLLVDSVYNRIRYQLYYMRV